MNLPDVDPSRPGSSPYGEPYQTPDGSTVITVTRNTGRAGARPLGVIVIKDGNASWVPTLDSSRIAYLGLLTGLVAAAFSTAAVLRRPPWPDVHMVVRR